MIKTARVEKRSRCGRQDPWAVWTGERWGTFPSVVPQHTHDPKEETLPGVPTNSPIWRNLKVRESKGSGSCSFQGPLAPFKPWPRWGRGAKAETQPHLLVWTGGNALASGQRTAVMVNEAWLGPGEAQPGTEEREKSTREAERSFQQGGPPISPFQSQWTSGMISPHSAQPLRLYSRDIGRDLSLGP